MVIAMVSKKIIFLSLFFLLTMASMGQLKNLSISAGISTIEILGNSPNSALIVNRNPDVATVGGSFDGTQPGMGFKISTSIDENNIYMIPIGLDYYFFEGLERIPAPGNYTSKWKHTAGILSLSAGFNYGFVKFPYANVRGYAGIEIRGTKVNQGELVQTTIDSKTNTTTVDVISTKENAYRLGGALYLGFVGDIVSPWYINTYIGIGIMNLVGRDDSRGELLTPFKYFETNESIIYNLHFSLLIQYRL
jgi:hypothetical protein